tara:strand:+ start:382 stop:870 length:489 start_codon:yes stop_codon:yes gene_type:complete
MSVKGKLEVSNGGKLKINNGKLSVETATTPAITFTIDILQAVHSDLYQGGQFRYAVGLGTNVTYDANYLARIDMSVSDAGDTQDQLAVSVPGAVLNDGVIDFYFYCIDANGIGDPVFLGWSNGAELGYSPTPTSLTNALRVPFKAGTIAGGALTPEVEIEWE